MFREISSSGTQSQSIESESVIGGCYRRIGSNSLGAGAYGVVYKGNNIKTGQIVALKKIKLPDIDDEVDDGGVPSTSIREVSLLKELQHPNIVRLLDVVIEEWASKLYLVFEFLPMDLKKYIETENSKNRLLDPSLIQSYTYQLLLGLVFCHQRRIFHRDLKPQNLLIDEFGCIKIADFGLARAFSVPMLCYTPVAVTLWYRAPELLLQSPKYSCPIDIWSMGTILAEMVLGKPLFHGDSEIDQLYQIFRVLRTPTEEIWPGVTQLPAFQAIFPSWTTNKLRDSMMNLEPSGFDLLELMLTYDPRQRISARKALLHPYFDNLDKKLLPAKHGEDMLEL